MTNIHGQTAIATLSGNNRALLICDLHTAIAESVDVANLQQQQ
jgi:hypothetical protein